MAANDIQEGGDHYRIKAIQPWDFIHQNGIGFLAGCAIKYLARYKDKNGLVDLKKARHFVDKLIEVEQEKIDGRVLEKLNEPKIGSKIKCLDTTKTYSELSFGTIYSIVKIDVGNFYVINDKGQEVGYFKHRFQLC
jgi:hypothetical protein